jgi:glycerol transport system ATP-binding protein
MARVELKSIGHSYGKGEADSFSMSGLNLAWEDGSANALLGPSGCGKTTVLNVISGLLHPDHGQIVFDGRDVTELDARGRHIAQVFQFPVLYETMNVSGNLAFPLRNRGMSTPDVDRRVHEVAELLDLTADLKTPSRSLTPAQKQIVSLGRGIVREDTAAVLLDEPLTVIDPKLKWHLRRKLREVQRETNLTMIYVTHDQHEALTFADHVTVMHDGSVVQTGTPEELHEHPATPFVGYFIGSPGMNLIACRVVDGLLDCGAFQLPMPKNDNLGVADDSANITLGIRPEHICVSRDEVAGSISVKVRMVENAGAYKILTVATGAVSFRVRAEETAGVVEGESVFCTFDEERLHVYSSGESNG